MIQTIPRGGRKWPIRIEFDTNCCVYKYVPRTSEARPGEIFLRVGKVWRLQSIVRLDEKCDGKSAPLLE